MQAICKPFAWGMLACCYGIPLVFPWYSLGILLVFSSYSAPFSALPSRSGCCKPLASVPRYGHLIRRPIRDFVHFTLFSFQIWISVPA